MLDPDLEHLCQELDALEKDIQKTVPLHKQKQQDLYKIQQDKLDKLIDNKFSNVSSLQTQVAEFAEKNNKFTEINNELTLKLAQEQEKTQRALKSLKTKYLEAQKLQTALNKLTVTHQSDTTQNSLVINNSSINLQAKFQQALEIIRQQHKIIMQLKLHYKKSLLSIQSTLKNIS